MVALYGQAERVAALVPAGQDRLALLHSRSVPESLQGERPPEDALISIVSRWSEFLHWSRVILVAAGLDPQALDFRDARAGRLGQGLALKHLCHHGRAHAEASSSGLQPARLSHHRRLVARGAARVHPTAKAE